MICPYCDAEIHENAVEAEDGFCPECGVSLTAASVFSGELDDDDIEDVDIDNDEHALDNFSAFEDHSDDFDDDIDFDEDDDDFDDFDDFDEDLDDDEERD